MCMCGDSPFPTLSCVGYPLWESYRDKTQGSESSGSEREPLFLAFEGPWGGDDCCKVSPYTYCFVKADLMRMRGRSCWRGLYSNWSAPTFGDGGAEPRRL